MKARSPAPDMIIARTSGDNERVSMTVLYSSHISSLHMLVMTASGGEEYDRLTRKH